MANLVYIEPFFVCPMIKSPESYSKTKKREDKWQILFVLSHFSCSLSVSIYLPRIFNYFDFPPGTFFLLYISLSPHPLFDWKSIGDSVGISWLIKFLILYGYPNISDPLGCEISGMHQFFSFWFSDCEESVLEHRRTHWDSVLLQPICYLITCNLFKPIRIFVGGSVLLLSSPVVDKSGIQQKKRIFGCLCYSR